VVGIRGPREIRLVAGIARGRRRRVIVVRVALRASQGRMHSRQRIVCIKRVIKCDRVPVGCVVAGIARRGKRRRHVVRVAGPCKVCLVAAVAGRWQS
jgi:hypothetical protein